MSADAIVKSFIDRILRLKEEQDTLAADIREVYAEAKGNGYDKTAMGAVVAHLRKIDKHGADACEERDAAFGLYLDAYERATGTGLATHTHEAAPAFAEWNGVGFVRLTGEITDTQEQPETATRCNTPVSRAAGFDPAEGQHGEHGQDGSYCRDSVERHAPIPQSDAASSDAATEPQASPAVAAPIPEGIPAFLLKERKPLRPNCLNPDNCAGYGSHTCHSCTRAMAESEAA